MRWWASSIVCSVGSPRARRLNSETKYVRTDPASNKLGVMANGDKRASAIARKRKPVARCVSASKPPGTFVALWFR